LTLSTFGCHKIAGNFLIIWWTVCFWRRNLLLEISWQENLLCVCFCLFVVYFCFI
jgi:hypothetical protein